MVFFPQHTIDLLDAAASELSIIRDLGKRSLDGP
jgi:hypothetical protein